MARKPFNSGAEGFTILELLIVIIIIGILSAIAAPSWLGFVNSQRLRTSQEQVYRAMQEAKSNATRDKITWQTSFKDDGIVKFAVHPANANYLTINWQNLNENVRIVDTDAVATDPNDTTLYFDNTNRVWRVQFNYKGNTNGQLGKITLSNRRGGQAKRCVIVSTLIGAMRRDEDNGC